MKTKDYLPKIVSTSIALILCSAVLLFALTLLSWGGGLPAHAAHAGTCHLTAPTAKISPSSGAAANTTITVSNLTTVEDSNGPGTGECPSLATGTATFSVGSPNCSSITNANVGSAQITGGGFNGQFTWPPADNSTTATYKVCVEVGGGNSTVDAGTFTVTAPTGSISLSPTSGGASTTVTVTGTGLNATGTVTFQWSSHQDCSSGTSLATTNSPVTISNGGFSAKFLWPSGASAAGTYYVCAKTSTGTLSASFTVGSSSSSKGSVSVDASSYKVGDNITITLSGFPANTSVSLSIESSNGNTTHDFNAVTTDTNGASTTVHTIPASPTGKVDISADGGGVSATSSTFTVNKKTSTTTSPPPVVAPPPPVAPAAPPPVAIVPTPTAVPTDTPTPVPTDTPTPVPSPTAVTTTAPRPVTTNNNSLFSSVLGGKLPAIIGIGLGTLLGLGILFAVGWMLLRKFLAPAPQTTITPSAVPPWMRQDTMNMPGNNMNGGMFGQTMSFDNSFPPGNGGFAAGPDPFGPGNGGFGLPQQVPFNGPGGPGDAGFAPVGGGFGPPQQGYVGQGDAGFAPAGVAQEPFPPQDWFAPSN